MSARSTAATLVRKATSFAGTVMAVRTDAPEFVLTYDDGPVAGSTDRILAVLAERGATATFFMLLSRVRADPGLLAEVVAAGHEVALHGVDHRDLTTFPLDEVRRRMHDGRRELEDAAGRPVPWFRPPYGHQTFGVWRAIRAAGMTPVLWGPSTGDSRGDFDQEQRVTAALTGAMRGAILLAHDNFADALDGVDDGTPPLLDRADLLVRVLDGYAGLGLHARSLTAALATGAPVFEGRFTR
ncbi:polysaccharide deacetylase family protein [Leifsonia poae]|uniref:polysaccharide deacetylase family protein n=1 Tax=Leifsonia poae TaxID=110933 RepID=UPI001CC1BE2B|nr:polysaccharide deacetylase family protein [Leifsonia poae]